MAKSSCILQSNPGSQTQEPSACHDNALQAYHFFFHLAIPKVKREEAEVTAILPCWLSRVWLLFADLPMVLPECTNLFWSP